MKKLIVCVLALGTFGVFLTPYAVSVSQEATTPTVAAPTTPAEPVPDVISEENPIPEPKVRTLAPLPNALSKQLDGSVPLNPERTAFLNSKEKKLLLHTEIACNDCLLEMFCCIEQTKEHESVLRWRGKAYVLHAGLMATGAKPGKPVSFRPDFTPPSGELIDIIVHWQDEDGTLKQCNARDWMRRSVSHYYAEKLPKPPPGVELPLMELRFDPYNKEILWFGQMSKEQRDKLLELWDDKQYQAAILKFYKDSQPRPMTSEFVFTGSYEYVPNGHTKKVYAAESGQLICVANFAESIIDVREASSSDDGAQSYEAVPERVPPRGTPVLLELKPSKKIPAVSIPAKTPKSVEE